MSYQSNKEANKSEIDTTEWAIAITSQTMMFFRGIWEILGIRSRKVLEHFKQSLVDNPTRSMEDDAAESNMEYEGQSNRLQYYPLNYKPFLWYFDKEYGMCHCPKNLTRDKLKSIGLIFFSGEISRQSEIDSAAW